MFLYNNVFKFNFNLIAYIHIAISTAISIYITSRGTLKIDEEGISITTLLGKRKYCFRHIEYIKRSYTKENLGILELVIKTTKQVASIDLDNYRKTSELEQLIKSIFKNSPEKLDGEFIYEEKDKQKNAKITWKLIIFY